MEPTMKRGSLAITLIFTVLTFSGCALPEQDTEQLATTHTHDDSHQSVSIAQAQSNSNQSAAERVIAAGGFITGAFSGS
ncbi:MAG: hypothetical protein CMF50_02900 [Legionellales bacterium]|nr:hypothetical protein [Legionellales bacterium]|tara:strand:+ start:49876 stop:50112 length:237 start_codon:yes stop_codon:yes gene_type:complete